MTDRPVWDGRHLEYQDEEIIFDNPYEPWKNITKTTRTVTTSIRGIQQALYKEKTDPIKTKDIAEALEDRNLLRQTQFIQISSNKKFLAITFETKQIMETFCTEPLLVKGYNINFQPDKNFPRKKPQKLLNISFLNVPSKMPDQPLTELLADYADIVGEPLYIQKDYNGIPYYNGTRVYQVRVLH